MAMDVAGTLWRETIVNGSEGEETVLVQQGGQIFAYMSPSMRRLEETDAPGATTNVGFWELGLPFDFDIRVEDQWHVINHLGQLEVYHVKATFHSPSHPLWIMAVALKVS
jgi:hypothetical protein